MQLPRPEYPRPQMIREKWVNLNGEWEFQIDNEKSGEYRELFKEEHLAGKIIVPFCPESELSKVNNKDFMNCVWYKRKIDISSGDLENRILIHFGAVDYHSILYINSKKVGEHKGGYTSFSFDITDFLVAGKNDVTLCVYDDVRGMHQPSGKQSRKLNSAGCYYTRVTGIWQTVWLEFVKKERILSINFSADFDNSGVVISIECTPYTINKNLSVKAFFESKEVGETKATITANTIKFFLKLSEIHKWQPGEGNLYDIEFTIFDEFENYDFVKSYFGLRTVGLSDKAFFLNGKKVFGRWVLDQGYYPNGIYTAPTEEALKNDIKYSMELGFNGARLHQKVFEPGFLYWADKLGYMVWGEYASWGVDVSDIKNIEYFLPEWIESVKRDISHPSIIGWCPFNETWDVDFKRQNDMFIKTVYDATKAIDKFRPVIDTSGNYHTVTDIFDVHDYEQDVEKFNSYYEKTSEGIICDQVYRKSPDRQVYKGEPIFISEYGGIKWTKDSNNAWGYGNAPKTEEEFLNRYEGLTNAILNNPDIMGFCYTQLYDIEQEQNGLLTYERGFKFNPDIIRKINTKKAAIEIEEGVGK